MRGMSATFKATNVPMPNAKYIGIPKKDSPSKDRITIKPAFTGHSPPFSLTLESVANFEILLQTKLES